MKKQQNNNNAAIPATTADESGSTANHELPVIVDIEEATTDKPGHAALESLNVDEQKVLADCEAIIKDNKDAFLKTGLALMIIKDQRLYRQQYTSFEQYCAEQWQLGVKQAYRFIQAAEVVGDVGPIGDTNPIINESQARVVAKAPREKRKEVVKRAIEKAAGKEPTAATYDEARKEVCGEGKRSQPATPTDNVLRPANYLEGDYSDMIEWADTACENFTDPEREAEVRECLMNLVFALKICAKVYEAQLRQAA